LKKNITLIFIDIKAGCYHAGLSALARTQVHEKWLQNQVHVICATIAFGLFNYLTYSLIDFIN
jgi:superfamily II DNA helicase RecQ